MDAKLPPINVTHLFQLRIHIAFNEKSPVVPRPRHRAVRVQNETVRERNGLEFEGVLPFVPVIGGVLLFIFCGTCNAKHGPIDEANTVVKNLTLIANSGGVSVCMPSNEG